MWCRVLLLDDDIHVINALRRELTRKPDISQGMGLEIESFTAPLEALTQLHTDCAYDVAIVDYSMPQLNGLDFLRELKALSPRTVRILLTGQVTEQSGKRAINDVGLDYLLTKPWHEFDLKGMVATALNQRQARMSAPPVATGPWPRERPYHVMLVDEDASFLADLARDIDAIGVTFADGSPLLRVSCHSDSASVQHAMGHDSPDVVIVTYTTLGIDGVSFLHRLRMARPNIIRILLSRHGDSQMLIDAINIAGVHRFVPRPWRLADLQEALVQPLVERDCLRFHGRIP